MTKRNHAFSLIEIILAIGIFAIVAVSLLTLLNRGLQISREFQLDGAAAVLSGKITSLLKASYAWNDNYSSNPNLVRILQRNLAQVAAGSPSTTTNRYTRALQHEDDPGRKASEELEIEVVTDISPLNDSGALGRLVGNDDLNQAINRIRDFGKNCVFVQIRISYPANAPANLRSTREFASIVSISTDE